MAIRSIGTLLLANMALNTRLWCLRRAQIQQFRIMATETIPALCGITVRNLIILEIVEN